MNDRELLEMAAKAAGIKLEWVPTTDGGCHVLWGTCRCWSPLYNDGDALRLAVKLRFSVDFWETGATLTYEDGDELRQLSESGPDGAAATRRAIVRAAAEIGRSK